MELMRRFLFLFLLVLLPVHFVDAQDVSASRFAFDSPTRILDRYIVVFKKHTPPSIIDNVAQLGSNEFRFSSPYGIALSLPPQALNGIIRNPNIEYIEADQKVTSTQSISWGLDRIDQRNLPLNGLYNQSNLNGEGVHIYVLDSGIRTTHAEFTGRIGAGFTVVGSSVEDCHGHGTHVAGIAAGSTYGIAKRAIVHPIRVLDCLKEGTVSGVIAGVDWVTRNAIRPAVASMSLAVDGGISPSLETAIGNSIFSGIPYAIAAGNSNTDACNVSPARVPEAITVGATSSADSKVSFSNYGACVDIFAPGENILSAGITSDISSNVSNGTSMAAPYVSGLIALHLQSGTTPRNIPAVILQQATNRVLSSIPSGTTNKLAYAGPFNFLDLPAKPNGLTAECVTNSSQLRVWWNSVATAVSFNIRVNDMTDEWYSAASDIILDNFAGISFIFQTILGRQYNWWIHAVNDVGATEAVGAASVVGACSGTAVATPAPPQNLVVTQAANIATLTWSAVSGATAYEVRVNDLSDGGWTPGVGGDLVINNHKSNSYILKLAPGRTYGWWVHSTNSMGTSDATGGPTMRYVSF